MHHSFVGAQLLLLLLLLLPLPPPLPPPQSPPPPPPQSPPPAGAAVYLTIQKVINGLWVQILLAAWHLTMQSSHGLSRLAVAAWEGGLRFDPSGAAHDANLRGVELRVDRSANFGSSAENTSTGTGVPGGTAAAVPTVTLQPPTPVP